MTLHQKNGELDPGEICERWLDEDDPMRGIRRMHEDLIERYYKDVLKQARTSFRCAVTLSMLGFLVLVGTIAVVVYQGMTTPGGTFAVGLVGVTSGALIELLSAAVFLVYKRATDQFNTFHTCLERMNRYIMSHAINRSIEDGSASDQVRRDLACIIASAPMITLPQDAKGLRTIRPSFEGWMPGKE